MTGDTPPLLLTSSCSTAYPGAETNFLNLKKIIERLLQLHVSVNAFSLHS